MRKIILVLALFMIFLVGCSVPQESEKDDTQDIVDSGNNDEISEDIEIVEPELPVEEKPKAITDEVQELIDKSATRVKSIRYSYRGPQSPNDYYEFYVMGDDIKYIPSRQRKTLDFEGAFDTIFVNTKKKTASSYCESLLCKVKRGLIENLTYEDAYIWTPFDWLNSIESAEKIGEQLIEQRNTWKVKADFGTLWVESYYGTPYQIESAGKVYKFEQVAFNQLKKEDVLPTSE